MTMPLRGLGPPDDTGVREVSTGDDHHYAMWDAAYVLGALSAADRREFEAHLAGCPECRGAVTELCGVPALLSQLDRDEVAAISESAPTVVASGLSPELLPSLLAAVHRRRRRTRLITWVASSAAAAVLAIGVLVSVCRATPRHRSGRPCRRCRWPRSARSCWRPRCRSAASLGGRSSTCGASAWRRRMLPTTRWPWLWWVVTAARHGWRLGWPNPVTPRHPPAAFRHRLTRSPPCKWLPPIPARFCCSVRSKTEL